MIKKIIVLLAFVPTLLFARYKDVLEKKNGDLIRCTITKEDSTKVYFDLKQNGIYVSSMAEKGNLKAIVYGENNKFKKKLASEKNKNIDTDFDTDNIGNKEAVDIITKSKKHFKVELDFDPFGEYSSIFRFNEIQFKYILDDRISLRCALELDYEGNSS